MTLRPLSTVLIRLIWLCMAPLLLLAVWLEWSHLEELEAKHLREADHHARNFATTIDRLLDVRLRALNMLAVSPLADDPRRWPELYREAQGFHESFGTHVIFADEQHQMLFNTRQPYGTSLPHLPLSKGRSAARLALETGKPQVGDIVQGPVANIPLMALVVPVLRADKPTRLILSNLEASQLQDRIDQLALPEGWSVALQDGTGADIARRSLLGFDSARDVAADHRFVVPLEQSAWSVVLEIPRSSHAELHREALLYLGAILLLALALSLAGGLLAGRRIARQVAALAEPAGDTGTALDIAEIDAARKTLVATAAELAASQQRLQLWGEAFRRAEMGIAISDVRTNTYLVVNPAFARQRGYTEDELVGQSILDTVPADRREELRAKLPSIAAQGHVVFESEHQRKDGSRFPIQVDLTVLYDTDGAPLNRIGFVQDITDRKRVEQALAASQAAELEQQTQTRLAALNLMDDAQAALRLAEQANRALQDSEAYKQTILDSVSAEIAVLDQAGVIVAVNEPWRRFALENGSEPGMPAARTAIGTNYLEICQLSTGPFSDDAPEAHAGILTVLEGRQGSFTLEYPCHAPDRQRWFSMSVTPLGATMQGVVIAHTDITARKTAETELHSRNEVLERFNRATAGREMRMIALKQQVNALARQLGQPQPYPLDFLKADGTPSADPKPQE